jgi:shikimate kinase/3-dehydroquinate synthase
MAQTPIALSGFMGAGKTTIGARLARSRGLVFVDLDEELAAAFACSLGDVFARDGEAAFREMEERLLWQALSLPDRVVALGGGAVLSERNRSALAARATWIHLEVPLRELERRVGAAPGRPLWDDRVAERFAARAPLYGEAHYQVDGAIEHILDASPRTPVAPPPARAPVTETVAVPGASYDVVVGRGLHEEFGPRLSTIGAGPIALLTDWNVGPLHGDAALRRLRTGGRRVSIQTLPAGEEHKALPAVTKVVERLLDAGWQRRAPVVALGGGVLGDMAGLVAALLLRGVPFVQVPTTLLAMVDASVGGKVGVNHRRGKNLIGSFWQPALVWTDLAYLDTLPDRELRAGLAEVVKTALLGDTELFERLEREPRAYLSRDPDALMDAVLRCVRFKAGIVARDAREAGVRASLNLGHTVGHALEATAAPGILRHGEAVAIGLVAAVEVSRAEGLCDDALPDRLRGVLTGLGLPIAAPPLPRSGLVAAINGDKKLNDDDVLWILVETIAQPRLVMSPLADLDARLDTLERAGVLTALENADAR